MSNWSERDLSAIDLRTLPDKEWTALMAEVQRRARAERAQVVRTMAGWLRGWARRAGPARRLEARGFAAAQKRPVFFGGRA